MGKIRGSSYYTIVNKSTWTEAESQAVNLGGHLVTINNKSEYLWLRENIFGIGSQKAYFVGLNDASNEGSYVWSSGETTDWTNITSLIHRQNWILQQHNASANDYFIVHANDTGFTSGTDYRFPSVDLSKYGQLIWVDNNSSYYSIILYIYMY